MTDPCFNSKTVCKLTKVTQRQLNDWVSKNVIVPSLPQCSGRGKPLLFNFVDLVQVRTASFLRSKGISLQNVRRSLEYIRGHYPEIKQPLAELRFLTDGQSVFFLALSEDELEREQKRLINASEYGQLVCIFKLGEAAKDLEEEVKQFILGEKRVIQVKNHSYLVIITPDTEDGGYVASCEELPGCFSQGETKKETELNIKAAIMDWLGEEESKRIRA